MFFSASVWCNSTASRNEMWGFGMKWLHVSHVRNVLKPHPPASWEQTTDGATQMPHQAVSYLLIRNNCSHHLIVVECCWSPTCLSTCREDLHYTSLYYCCFFAFCSYYTPCVDMYSRSILVCIDVSYFHEWVSHLEIVYIPFSVQTHLSHMCFGHGTGFNFWNGKGS